MKIKTTLAFLFLLFSLRVLAQENNNDSVIVFNNPEELLLIGKQVYFLEDAEGKLTIEDVLKPENQKKFIRNNQDAFSRSASKSIFWLKMTFRNLTSEKILLELGSTFVWYIDFYKNSKDKFILTNRVGSLCPEINKPYQVPLIWLPLYEDSTIQSVYLRIESQTPIEIPIQVGSLSSLHKNKAKSDYLVGAFMGLVGITFFFNLFLLVSTKDKIYVWYLLYLLTAFYQVPFLGNYPFFIYIFPDSFKNLIYLYYPTWQSLFYLFISLFFISFLNLKNYLKLFNYFIILIFWINIIIPIIDIFSLLSYYILNWIYQISLFIFMFSIFVTALYLLLKNEKNALFFCLGWSWVLLGFLIYVLSINGIIQLNYFTRSATFIGISIEILMFSLALANRLNIMRKEKAQAQAENLKLVQEQNVFLEQKVRERTQEIETQAEELQSSNQALQVANHEIQKHNEDVRSSINAAFRIQTAMLPFRERIDKALGKENYFMLYKPRDIVSGDFYYFEQFDNQVLITVADCTGHGVPGAFMSMIGINFLEDIVKNQKITQPSRVLHLLNQNIRQALKQDQHQTREGMDMNLICIDQTQKMVQYAGAMNPLYYIENQEFKELKATKKPIGGMQTESEREYAEHIISFGENPQGLTLYLCTDGYQDQFGGEKNRKFMVGALKKLLFSIHEKPMPEQHCILDETIENWREQGNESQIDDITIMGLKLK